MKNNCVGFISKKTGVFEPLTTGEFFNYPDRWIPVYKTTIEKNQILNTIKIFPESKEALQGLFPEYFPEVYCAGKIYCFLDSDCGYVMKLHKNSTGKFEWISLNNSQGGSTWMLPDFNDMLNNRNIDLKVFNNQKELAEWMYNITK